MFRYVLIWKGNLWCFLAFVLEVWSHWTIIVIAWIQMKPLKQSLSHGVPTNLTQLTTKRSQLMYRHYLAEQYNTAEVCKPQKFRVL